MLLFPSLYRIKNNFMHGISTTCSQMFGTFGLAFAVFLIVPPINCIAQLSRPPTPPSHTYFGRPLTLPFIGIAPRYCFFLLQVSIGGGDRRIGGGRAGCVPLLHNHILASNRCFLGHRQPSHSATVGGNLCGRRWDLFHDNPFRRQIAGRGRGVAGNSRSAAFHGGRRRRYCLLSP